MPAAWVSAGAAVLGAGATAYGASQSSKAAKAAAKAGAPRNFNLNTPYGNSAFTPGGVTATGGIGAEYGDQFAGVVGSTLRDFGNVNTGRVGGAPFDLQAALGAFGNLGATGTSNQADALGGDFLSQARQALGAAGGFDINAFAGTQFDRLSRLAAPGEQTAANSLATNLFSSGRLGANDSRSGELFKQLDLSQGMQRDARAGQALGLATSESQRLFGLADSFTNQFGALGGLSQNLRAGNQQQTGDLFSSLRGDQFNVANFQNNLRNTLLSQATGGQTGIQNAFAGLNNAINQSMTGGLGVATGNANAQQFNVSAANNTSNLLGSFGAGLINAGANYYANRPGVQQPGGYSFMASPNQSPTFGFGGGGSTNNFSEFSNRNFIPAGPGG